MAATPRAPSAWWSGAGGRSRRWWPRRRTRRSPPRHPGRAQRRGGAAQDGEGVAVLARQLHLDLGVAGLGGILRHRWGAGRRVACRGLGAGGPGHRRRGGWPGCCRCPSGCRWWARGGRRRGDGAAVAGPQAGVGVVGGDQLDAVAGGEFHGGLPAARGGYEPSWWRMGSGRSPSWAPWPRSTTRVPSRSTWTRGVAGVDGVRERPGGLLGEADLGVGLAGLQLVEQVGDGDPVEVHRRPCSIRRAGIRGAGMALVSGPGRHHGLVRCPGSPATGATRGWAAGGGRSRWREHAGGRR